MMPANVFDRKTFREMETSGRNSYHDFNDQSEFRLETWYPDQLRRVEFPAYQRHSDYRTSEEQPSTKVYIDRLANKLSSGEANPKYIQPIEVNVRRDGQVVCIDGGHRLRAALKANKPLRVIVNYNIPEDEEVRKFNMDNGTQRSLPPHKLWENDIENGLSKYGEWIGKYMASTCPLANRISYGTSGLPINQFTLCTINYVGGRFNPSMKQPMQAALGNRLLRDFGLEAFTERAKEFWSFVETVWGDDTTHLAFYSKSLRGVTQFCIQLKKNSIPLTSKSLQRKMQSFEWRKYHTYKSNEICEALVRHYNSRRKPENQISIES